MSGATFGTNSVELAVVANFRESSVLTSHADVFRAPEESLNT